MKTTIITGGQGSGKNLKASELIAGRPCISLTAEHLDNKQEFIDLIYGKKIIVIDEVTNKFWLQSRLQALILSGSVSLRKPYHENQEEFKVDELFLLSQEKLDLKLNDGDVLIEL